MICSLLLQSSTKGSAEEEAFLHWLWHYYWGDLYYRLVDRQIASALVGVNR